jgi:hypothetical protein
MSYGTAYIDIPQITKTAKSGGKVNKMTKTTQTEAVKASKKYAKTRGEHYKDIVITILVTAIVAFICGAVFQSKQHNAITTAVKAVTPSASAEASK